MVSVVLKQTTICGLGGYGFGNNSPGSERGLFQKLHAMRYWVRHRQVRYLPDELIRHGVDEGCAGMPIGLRQNATLVAVVGERA